MSDDYQVDFEQLRTSECLMLLSRINRGIEKEGLRVTPKAIVAQTKHPETLGAALTHPAITTDYSEALLEFITPTFQRIDDCISCLEDLHSYTLKNIKNELLWPASMPCKLDGDTSIPIAHYGNSNNGQLKYTYRLGLGNRYGRMMQSIAGIHYNFSMPEDFWRYYQKIKGVSGDLHAFQSQCYFDLIRNFRRHSWLLIYLFGASPVLDSSFIKNRDVKKLTKFHDDTLGLPFATSLRMSDLGYRSEVQKSLNINYNNLDNYCYGMSQAIRKSYNGYEKIGVKVGGQYCQLNTNILQIENEYYSEIRPKRTTQANETPVDALANRGVEYVEVRLLDINPLLPVGIDAKQIRFLDAFLLYCLLSDSPESNVLEEAEITNNQQQIALEGRNPSIVIQQAGRDILFTNAAHKVLEQMTPYAALLDQAHGNVANTSKVNEYNSALCAQVEKIKNNDLSPSSMLVQDLKNQSGFVTSMLNQAKKHQEYFSSLGLPAEKNTQLRNMAKKSLQDQQQLEKGDNINFDEFLKLNNEFQKFSFA